MSTDFLDTAAATAYVADRRGVRLAPSTLPTWRSRRQGPPYHRVGGRVVYAVADLDRWLDRGRVEPGAPEAIAASGNPQGLTGVVAP